MKCYKVNMRIFAILLLMSLTGCTSLFDSNDSLDDADQTLGAPSTNNATLALLDSAIQDTEAGNLEVAAATIERALRIEPRNPQLWYRLALIRFDQGKHRLAANLAAKSNSFAANNTVLINKNRDLIEQARQ